MILPSKGMFGNVWRHFWLAQLVGRCLWHPVIHAKKAAKLPTVPRTVPAPNYCVNSLGTLGYSGKGEKKEKNITKSRLWSSVPSTAAHQKRGPDGCCWTLGTSFLLSKRQQAQSWLLLPSDWRCSLATQPVPFFYSISVITQKANV